METPGILARCKSCSLLRSSLNLASALSFFLHARPRPIRTTARCLPALERPCYLHIATRLCHTLPHKPWSSPPPVVGLLWHPSSSLLPSTSRGMPHLPHSHSGMGACLSCLL